MFRIKSRKIDRFLGCFSSCCGGFCLRSRCYALHCVRCFRACKFEYSLVCFRVFCFLSSCFPLSFLSFFIHTFPVRFRHPVFFFFSRGGITIILSCSLICSNNSCDRCSVSYVCIWYYRYIPVRHFDSCLSSRKESIIIFVELKPTHTSADVRPKLVLHTTLLVSYCCCSRTLTLRWRSPWSHTRKCWSPKKIRKIILKKNKILLCVFVFAVRTYVLYRYVCDGMMMSHRVSIQHTTYIKQNVFWNKTRNN